MTGMPAAAPRPRRRAPIASIGQGARRIGITEPDRATLLDDLDHRLSTGEGFAVATLNLDHLVKLGRDDAFRRAYATQTHVTADGNPVVWLAQLAGTPVALIPGADLTPAIAALAARLDAPIAMVGATTSTLDRAAHALSERSPGLRIVYLQAPSRNFDPDGTEAAEIIKSLKKSGARLVLLALGAPRQECLAARALSALPNTGFVSIGAGLDFLAGSQQRAPAWMRRLALEWLWRLMSEPRRLALRYLDCALVLPTLAMSALSDRRQQDKAAG